MSNLSAHPGASIILYNDNATKETKPSVGNAHDRKSMKSLGQISKLRSLKIGAIQLIVALHQVLGRPCIGRLKPLILHLQFCGRSSASQCLHSWHVDDFNGKPERSAGPTGRPDKIFPRFPGQVTQPLPPASTTRYTGATRRVRRR